MCKSRFFTTVEGLNWMSELLDQGDLSHDYWGSDGSQARWIWDSEFDGSTWRKQIAMGLKPDLPIKQVSKPGFAGLVCYVTMKGGSYV